MGCRETDARNSLKAEKMKFGKQLLKQQKPEWANNYIAYKQLKQVIKNVINETTSIEASLDDKVACKQCCDQHPGLTLQHSSSNWIANWNV